MATLNPIFSWTVMRHCAAALVLCGVVSFGLGARAELDKLTLEESTWLKNHPEIRVGLMNDWPPFSFLDHDGSATGISPAFVRAINRRIGGMLKLVPGPWKQRYDDVKSKRLDVLLDLTPKPERKAFFNFTKPYLNVPHALVARDDVPRIDGIGTLDGKVMALEKGFGNIKRIGDKNPKIIIREYPVTRAALDAVSRGEAYAYAGNRAVATYLIEQEVMENLKVHSRLDFPGSVLAMGVRKDWPILRDILAKALADISESERRAIVRQWVGDSGPQKPAVALSADEKAWLAANPGPYKVHNETDWPPFNYFEDGQPKGYSIAYMNMLADRLGIEVEYVSGPSWSEFMDQIASKKIDLMLNIVKTDERSKFLAFTRPYIENPSVIVAQSDDSKTTDLKSLNGKTVSIPKGFYYQEVIEKGYPNIKLKLVTDQLAALKSVAFGNADATIGGIADVSFLMRKNGLLNLRIKGEIEEKAFSNPLRIAAHKDNAPLRDMLQKAIASVTNSEEAAIYGRWIGGLSSPRSVEEGGAELSSEEIAWIEKKGTIVVANETDWPPFDFFEDGEAKGLAIDMIREIADATGLKLRFVNGFSWAQLMEKFKAGEIDVLPAVYETPDRLKFMAFTSDYGTNPTVLVVNAKRQGISDLKDLAGRKTGIVEGFATADIMASRYPEIQRVEVKNVLAGLKAVALGEVEAFIGSFGVISHILDANVIPDIRIVGETYLQRPEETKLHIGVLKSQTVLRDILQKGLNMLSQTKRHEIRDRWLATTAVEPDDGVKLTYEEREWLRQHPTITLGNDFAWPPFSFTDDKGEFAGISASYVKALSKKLGVKFVPVTGLTWPQVLERVKSGGIDILPAATQTAERETFLNFTKPYISFPVVIATRKDGVFVDGLGDLVGLKVGVVDGYVTQGYLAKSHPELNLVPIKTLGDGLRALDEGRLDAFVDNLGSITYEVGRQNLTGVRIAAPTQYRFPLAFAVRKDWPQLVAILDKALASIDERERTAIKNSWIGIEVKFGWDKRQILTWALPMGGAVILVIIVFVIWNRRLGREVAERQRAEKQARERQAWFRSLLESAPDATFIVGSDGRIRRVNVQAEALFGYSRDEIIGEPVEMLLPEDIRAGHPKLREAFIQNSSTREMGVGRELRAIDRAGREFPVEVSLSPIEGAGEIEVVATVRDVSERRAAEEKLQKNLDELQAFNRLAIDRELRMIELKKEINELREALGQETQYEIVE